MERVPDKSSKLVFRLSGLPNAVETTEDVKSLVKERLDDIPVRSIHVYSLATTLNLWENPPSKIATIMFDTLPSLILESPDDDYWTIPGKSVYADSRLILDTNFLGMTPLNDVQPPSCHLYDCIAISGLASHPFGSWQPKGGDKTFMWIRDCLPKDLPDTRAIIYGFNTKLVESRSFQFISDLASELVSHLETYGGAQGRIKPTAFLAHSLGGLVLKQALVQLGQDSREAYKNLLRGVVFFGVPNLGMNQEHFRAIVQNNANEALVDDITRGSSFLDRLDKEFRDSPFKEHMQCIWAYETSESPTVTMTRDGNPRRDGPPAILVDRSSATCRLFETNRAATFPINETHSDMVKFRQGSHYYGIVISKLLSILSLRRQVEHGNNISLQSSDERLIISDDFDQVTAGRSLPGALPTSAQQRMSRKLLTDFEVFRRESTLTATEEKALKSTTVDDTRQVIRSLETAQEESNNLMYMGRLQPILVSMQQFGEFTKSLEIFNHVSHAMAYVWGSMKYVLQMISDFPEALNSVLDAYQRVGEQIPRLQGLERLFASSPLYQEILILIYKDILMFHGTLIRLLKQRQWKRLFKASWRDFTAKVEHIEGSIARKSRSIENQVSITEFEEIRKSQSFEDLEFSKLKDKQDTKRRAMIRQWLSPFDCESEQVRFRNARSICEDPGRWLLNDSRYLKWLNPEHCETPAIWLSGIPGAGKTILASIVVDEVQKVPGASVAFFYCKHGEKNRDTFLSVAKSILAQLLDRHPHLLPFFHERASISNKATLESAPIAKEMIEIALKSCEKTYLVIDGVDECRLPDRGYDDRKEIATLFQEIIKNLPDTEEVSMRCLFVSQDDDTFQRYFRDLPTIKIVDENQKDLKNFSSVWHQRIEEKFGDLRSKNYNISKIISARAQGMFIFAELFAKYLKDQISQAALIEELKPEKLPVNLDHVYGRILDRILESRGPHMVKHLRHILGWIVCARRPLRWREIQGAISLDLESQRVDYDKEIAESPKGLFASIVKIHADDTVELVHGTAREYLSQHFVDLHEANYSMAMLSLGYLTLPQVNRERNEIDIRSDLLSGTHSFYEYASACWVLHLEECISKLKEEDALIQLQKTLEVFVECHWSADHKQLLNIERIKKKFSAMQKSNLYGKITQAVASAKKQSGIDGSGPNKDEALDLWRVTEKLRKTLENMRASSISEADMTQLERFYGKNWFKCPRINCYHYHQGFKTAKKRNRHVNRHEHPFLCMVSGCHKEVFGCVTERDLKKHILENHGIDELDDVDDTDFPDPTKENAIKPSANQGSFKCSICSQTYTRHHNLKAHLRSHEESNKESKPFKCSVCEKQFVRKADCNRHEKDQHGEKIFVCTGELKDGSKWGCNASFGRADSLSKHFRNSKGQACLRPLVMEKSLEGVGSEAEIDSIFTGQVNKGALLSAYKSLPSFGEFLKLCGLENSL